MSVFNPQKLSTSLIPPATFTHPVAGRKYTLTHSDTTARLFLDIGSVYNIPAIHPNMRDEVLAEWRIAPSGGFNLTGTAYVDGGEFSPDTAAVRFRIFRKEMGTALQGIVYGDRMFYEHYPCLLDAPLFIRFLSSYPAYRHMAYYGTPRQYLIQAEQARQPFHH